MKKLYLCMAVAGFFCTSCSRSVQEQNTRKEPLLSTEPNPFLESFKTPFGVPPFDKIKNEHYMPAFQEGMKLHQQEIDAIAGNSLPASFENTIESMEKSGGLLTNVEAVFVNMLEAHTNDELQMIAEMVTPLLSKHYDGILMSRNLFEKIDSVVKQKQNFQLTAEQLTLLDKYYKDFVRGGANLDPEKKAQLVQINQELSVLSLKFGNNILKENNSFKLYLKDRENLSGLPEASIAAAAEAAKESGHEGEWLFTLHKPNLIPFLQYADDRGLREKMFIGYTQRGNHGNQLDNKAILTKMVELRLKRANLLGYETHADYVLEETMAKLPKEVYRLLQKLWKPALAAAKKEADQLQAMINKEDHEFQLKPWDWWYYTEKIRKQRFDLDEETLRLHFELDRVREGAFTVANKLFGLRFVERTGIPKYHQDVRVFEVKEADGSHIGLLYADYHPRASKQGGAWMDAYREQAKYPSDISPIVCNVLNVTKPTKELPSLLNLDEVTTLFHEFGHALHGLLSNVTYRRLSGTEVSRDFVELPSQIMENWATEPEVLRMYARHHQTGEVIPDELIEKIQASLRFNQGFATVEAVAASFLDMGWHTIKQLPTGGMEEFEKICFDKLGLIKEIVSRYESTYFSHIFSGGYSAGYYSYAWSAVLDADAFEAFKETGLFDQSTAWAFRKYILSTGGTQEPMKLYKQFRGAKPKIDPLLKRKGFIQ